MSSVTVETLAENASGNVANVINVLAKAIVDRTNIGVGLEIIECHTSTTPKITYEDVNGIRYSLINNGTYADPVYSTNSVEVTDINTTVFNASENHKAVLIPHYIKIELTNPNGDTNEGKIFEVKQWGITTKITEDLTDTTAFIAPYLEKCDHIRETNNGCVVDFTGINLVYAPKIGSMRLIGPVNFCKNSIVDLSSLTDITITEHYSYSFDMDYTQPDDKIINTLLIGVGVTAYTTDRSTYIGDGIYTNKGEDEVTSIFNANVKINEVRFVQTRFTNDIAYYRYNITYGTPVPFHGIAGGNYIKISGAQKPLLGFLDTDLFVNESYVPAAPASTIVYYPGSLKQIDDDDGTVPFKRFAVERTDGENMNKPFYVYGTLRGIAIEKCHRY